MLREKKLDFYYLGYFLRWVPQEMYYFSSKNIDFSANPERTEGTYTKYASLDDKIDGFFYYTSYIKFGIGRAMFDSASELDMGILPKKKVKLLSINLMANIQESMKMSF